MIKPTKLEVLRAVVVVVSLALAVVCESAYPLWNLHRYV